MGSENVMTCTASRVINEECSNVVEVTTDSLREIRNHGEEESRRSDRGLAETELELVRRGLELLRGLRGVKRKKRKLSGNQTKS